MNDVFINIPKRIKGGIINIAKKYSNNVFSFEDVISESLLIFYQYKDKINNNLTKEQQATYILKIIKSKINDKTVSYQNDVVSISPQTTRYNKKKYLKKLETQGVEKQCLNFYKFNIADKKQIYNSIYKED